MGHLSTGHSMMIIALVGGCGAESSVVVSFTAPLRRLHKGKWVVERTLGPSLLVSTGWVWMVEVVLEVGPVEGIRMLHGWLVVEVGDVYGVVVGVARIGFAVLVVAARVGARV